MPKVIHRIWIGGDMPQKFRDYGQQWREMNPDWIVLDWNEEALSQVNFHNRGVLAQMHEQAKQPGADMVAYYTHLADVMCYELVYQFGGLYINTDIKPLKPLIALEYNWNGPAMAMEDDVHPVNMAMYGQKGEFLFADIIDRLPQRYFGLPGQGMHITTGVGLIQQTLAETSHDVTFWNRNVWNPIHWSEIPGGTVPDMDREYPEETIAVHSWSHKEFQRGAEVLP